MRIHIRRACFVGAIIPTREAPRDMCKMQAKTCLEVSSKRTILHSALHIPQIGGGNGGMGWPRENTPRGVVSEMRLQLRDKTPQVRRRVFLRKTKKDSGTRKAFSVRGAINPRLSKLNDTARRRQREKEKRERRRQEGRGES